MIVTVIDEGVLVGLGTGVQHDECADRFAGVRVGDTHDSGLQDRGVAHQHFLDLGRIHVEARHDDEVLGSIDEVQVTVVVDQSDVTRVQPSVAIEHSRRRVGVAFQPASAKVVYQPLGVVGIIVPWNYPLFLAVGPMIGALAAGNRVMLKLSESTPATGELIKRLFAQGKMDGDAMKNVLIHLIDQLL